MIRRAAAVVLVLTLNPAWLHAQDSVLTVTVPSAEVHSGPSTVTPVISHVPRGTALPVSRNLGSWVKVAWPSAPDGVGYVHVTMGRLSGSTDAPTAAPSPQSPSTGATEPATTITPRTPTKARERVVLTGPQDATTISHVFGVGGMVGSMSSFGATARAWRSNRLGIQVGFTRDSMTSDVAAGRVTSMQFEPAVVYGLLDHVSDYVWIRPYVGSGVGFRHQTLKMSTATPIEPESDNGVGFRVFGGGELTFAGVPRLGLSAEVGYGHFPTAFPGFEPHHVGASIVGHWYIK